MASLNEGIISMASPSYILGQEKVQVDPISFPLEQLTSPLCNIEGIKRQESFDSITKLRSVNKYCTSSLF